jgi:hypothetical protein
MLKISIVILVTAAFAGLLIYDPYEPSANGATSPINLPPRLANGMPASTQADAVAASEAPPTRPQDSEKIVLKAPGVRIAPQEKTSSGTVAALPDKPVPTLAPRPLPASNESQQRPVLDSADQAPVVHAVFGRHEDPSVSSVDKVVSEKPASPQPSSASNGLQPRPVLQSVPQSPVGRPVLPRREDPPAPRLDVAFTVGPACGIGEVIGLDPNGDNFLSVRSGPGGSPYHEIDRLFSSDVVYVCGRNAPWLAVVYSPSRKASQVSCDIASNRMQHPYDGPCQYGWVHSRYIKPRTADTLARR